jgi:hypothetical protein
LNKIITFINIGIHILGALATPAISLAAEKPATEATKTATASGEAEKTAVSAALMGMSQTLMEGMIFGAALGLMAVGIATGSDTESPQSHGHGH